MENFEKYYRVTPKGYGHWVIELEIRDFTFKLTTTDSSFIDELNQMDSSEEKQLAIDSRFFHLFENQIMQCERYAVRCAENGDVIEVFVSWFEATDYVIQAENDDRSNDNYEPDFYEVYDLLTGEID